MTRQQFVTAITRNRMPYVSMGDDGVWHGQDFLYPGSNGTRVADMPVYARHCENTCCDCYVYMSPEAHQKEYGW